MKRAWIAAALLLAAITVSLLGVLRTNSITAEMKKDVMALQNMTEEQAKENVPAIRKEWEEKSKILSFYTRHSEVEDVTTSIALLEPMLEMGQTEMFYVECSRAINAIDHLRETEQPYIYNIL